MKECTYAYKVQHKIIRPPGDLLPADDNTIDCGGDSGAKCFKAGDVRVNEHIGLVALHTLWMRQHNRIARSLAVINPHWNDEQLFQVKTIYRRVSFLNN